MLSVAVAVRVRFPARVILLALTATLTAGATVSTTVVLELLDTELAITEELVVMTELASTEEVEIPVEETAEADVVMVDDVDDKTASELLDGILLSLLFFDFPPPPQAARKMHTAKPIESFA